MCLFLAAWTVTSVPGARKILFSDANTILLAVAVNSTTGGVKSITPLVFQSIYYFVLTVKPSISVSRSCYPWKPMTTSKVNFKEVSCFGGLMAKTLSCGLRDPGSTPGTGSFFYFSLFKSLASKTPCLQNPTRRSLLLERCHPDLSCCPCSLPMVCTDRSYGCLALRTSLRNHLRVPRRVLYPQWPKGIPHPLRE